MGSYFLHYSIVFFILFRSSTCHEAYSVESLIPSKHVRLIVAQDGSGDFSTINEALQEVPKQSNVSTYIDIKEGIYKEYVVINSSMWSVVLGGAGPEKTIIQGSNFYQKGHLGSESTTYNTATLTVLGDNFICANLSITNIASPELGPAVALLVDADKAVVMNCNISGYQNTLYTFAGRQLYHNCTVRGAIDIILGKARTVLLNSTIKVVQPLENQQSVITAQQREADDDDQRQAIVILNSTITPEPYFSCGSFSWILHTCLYQTFLGRPLGALARTIIANSDLANFIEPKGWTVNNSTEEDLDKCWFAEINNHGDGAELGGRVEAHGIKTFSDIPIDQNDYLESFWRDLDYAWPPW